MTFPASNPPNSESLKILSTNYKFLPPYTVGTNTIYLLPQTRAEESSVTWKEGSERVNRKKMDQKVHNKQLEDWIERKQLEVHKIKQHKHKFY